MKIPDVQRKVLLILDASVGYDRRVLTGVGKFARMTGRWEFRSCSPWETDIIRVLIQTWQPAGVISRFNSWIEEPFFGLIQNGLPVVQVDGIQAPVPQVYTDPSAVIELVVDHLVPLGVRSLGFIGGSSPQDLRRSDIFTQTVARKGLPCAIFRGEIRGNAETAPQEFEQWLRQRPLTTGLLTSGDWVGWHTIASCLKAGFRVPDDFAVMGIGNDQPWSELSPVPLSSVAVAAENIGYRAASLLDQILRGLKVPLEPIVIPPVGIVARRSTDIIAAEDPDIARVLRFIADHAAQGCTMNDVLRAVPSDRRRVERWFTKNLGRSPFKEIQRLRIAHVKKLLAETNENMTEIARCCGFPTAKLLSRAFHREAGMTLQQYRRQFLQSGRSI